MLDLHRVRVAYGDHVVIDGVDWSVGDDGNLVTALLGPSGCGKSTLLRAIAGLEPLAGGSVAWDGEDVTGVPAHRRDFGVVFQDGQLFSGRTVAGNIAYGLKLRKLPADQIAARVDEMLDLVQLPGIGDRPVTELSGGQAQRVALARALAPKPRLLLLTSRSRRWTRASARNWPSPSAISSAPPEPPPSSSPTITPKPHCWPTGSR